MTDHNAVANSSSQPSHNQLDRRTLLRRVGVGAAVVGAGWVAPEVVSMSPAWAACSPLVCKFLQMNAGACNTPVTTTAHACVPSNNVCTPDWQVGVLDSISYVCSNGDLSTGGTVTINSPCTPLEAKALGFCPDESSEVLRNPCTNGTISGNVVTFPTIPVSSTCFYVTFRITVSCCL